ncbi:MAG: Tn3 family transposase [Nitrosomonas sp.]|nr:Tn3 family transposase [Nitrosomonas sp.]
MPIPSSTPCTKALKAFGQIIKSLFILRYIDNSAALL